MLCIYGGKLFQLTPDPHHTHKVAGKTTNVCFLRKNERTFYKHLAL